MKPLRASGASGRELQLLAAVLAIAQLGLGGSAPAGALDGAVVLGPEALAQALGSAPLDGRGQDQYNAR